SHSAPAGNESVARRFAGARQFRNASAIFRNWSGRRDSNPRPQPWQGCALPLSYARAPGPAVPAERAPHHTERGRVCKDTVARIAAQHGAGGGPVDRSGPCVMVAAMVATEPDLIARLDALGIAYRTYRHRP